MTEEAELELLRAEHKMIAGSTLVYEEDQMRELISYIVGVIDTVHEALGLPALR